MSRHRFTTNLLALALGFGLFAVIEGVLSLVGVTPLTLEDPFVGFRGSRPLFVGQTVGDHFRYTLNPAKTRYFNPATFQMPKPPGTFRIVSFGGSTTYGRPFINDTSFPEVLRRLLGHLDGHRTYENINAGGISYASYRVLRLMKELSEFEPDLYVVYSGHNEFLEARNFSGIIEEKPALREVRSLLHQSRLYSSLYRGVRYVRGRNTGKTLLGEEVQATIEDIGGPELYHRDPAFREGVIRQYRHDLQEMIRLCRQKGIPVILCTVPSNLSGVSPFKSEHRDDLDPSDALKWESSFRDAQASLAAEDARGALAHLAVAEAIDDKFALLHYLKGKALQQLGESQEAYRAYFRAKDEDIVPLRALEIFNTMLREISAQEGVVLADVEARFRQVSPEGIPGPDLFLDHVHPTLKGQQLIAWVVAETAVRAGLVPLSSVDWQTEEPRAMEFLGRWSAGISTRYRAMGRWGVGRLFFWAGKYPEAYSSLVSAWETVRDVPEIPMELGIIELSRGKGTEALAFLAQAAALEPGNPNILHPMAKAYLLLRQPERALELLDRVEALAPRRPAVKATRGRTQAMLGHLEQGITDLEDAVRAAPRVPEFRLALAQVLQAAGNSTEAEKVYRDFLELEHVPYQDDAVTKWLRTPPDPIFGIATQRNKP